MTQHFKIPKGSPIQPVQPRQSPAVERRRRGGDVPFAQILDKKLEESKLKFSAHATRRLEARGGIEFSLGQLELLEAAVEKPEPRGGRETLILLDDVALVVSVANRTVITAIDGENLKENVLHRLTALSLPSRAGPLRRPSIH